MTRAEQIMREFNPNALIAVDEDESIVMIEDVKDPDGRFYRLEHRSTPDGERAISRCLYNPWGEVNGGEEYDIAHVASDGFLCLGDDHEGRELEGSPYDIDYVIRRARYWCTAFSVLKETREFPQM